MDYDEIIREFSFVYVYKKVKKFYTLSTAKDNKKNKIKTAKPI